MTEESDNCECPECGEIGKYEGKGCSGGNWTGTSYGYRYCPECDLRYKHEDKYNQSPTIA